MSLVDKARNEYGIVNADQMSEKQLKAEIAAIDAQPASDDHYVAPKKPAAKRAKKTVVKAAPKEAVKKRKKLFSRGK